MTECASHVIHILRPVQNVGCFYFNQYLLWLWNTKPNQKAFSHSCGRIIPTFQLILLFVLVSQISFWDIDDPHSTHLLESITSPVSSMKFITCHMQFHYYFLLSVWCEMCLLGKIMLVYYVTEGIQYAWWIAFIFLSDFLFLDFCHAQPCPTV
jgi:hypothetical protein